MRVAVIGGGIAGLSAAHELLRRGADPVVFEACARAGGKVGTRNERGYLSEDGPNFLARPLDALLDASGLRPEVVTPRAPMTRWIHLDGRVLRAPGLSLLARAGLGRALLEPLFGKPLRDDMPLGEFLERRLGRRAGGLAATVMSAGVYAGDPALLSARDAFPSLGALAERGSLIVNAFRRPEAPRSGIWTLRRGLGTLAGALVLALGGRVRLGARVGQLSPAQGGWSVQGERFEGVVLAVPAAAAADLTHGFAPKFADAARRFQSAPVTVVHLGLRQGGLPRGFGMIDADGGARHPERAALADGALVGALMADLRATWGVRDAPEYVRVVRWEAAIPQYAPGHRQRVREARELVADLPRLELAGAAWDGVGVPDVARSGSEAAARLVQ
ncbi:MAG: hypothetical protein E6J65_20355 [Deltaproteobacteria bacterium]|nr:MAG: hypothetical protein E6J65_20355 [Deltaproteobacteria bacterium]